MKPYVKPELYFESFELAQHIAGCNLELMKSGDPANCAASGTIGKDTADSWFIDGNRNCNILVEGYCWTNSSMSLTTINS